MDCVFCKIFTGEEKSNMVYQDSVVSCFLPVDMEVYGHLLLIPNNHYEDIFDIPEKELLHIAKIIKQMSLHLKDKIGATGINILHASGKDAQQSVFHFHMHIFPRFENDGLDTWPKLEKKEFNKQEILNKIKL